MTVHQRSCAGYGPRHRFAVLRGLLAVLTLALVAAAAGAQTVRGVLVHEVTAAPVSGAYVVLLGGDSVEVTRALTNPLGQFTIHAPRAGSYWLRTEQIGYRSVVSWLFELADGEVLELELVVEPVIVNLDPLTIEGSRECRVIGDQALQVLTVWEETRKVLTAVAWSDPQEELLYELERFERWFTPSFRLAHEKRTTTPTHHVMPFRSRSVEELEEIGYVVVEEDSVLYEAPDAEVFFSAPFLQHHCFRLDQKRQGGRRMLGLRFEPVRGRTKPDVEGVFWLDGETGALESLELEYVNVGVWQRERGAAGELEFERLPDGQWFVGRWWIRMPLVRRVESMAGPVWHFPEAVVGFKEEGGEVLKVYAADGRTVYARGRASVNGVVFDSTTGVGLAGAYVRLVGTTRVTISEAGGSYWLTDLPQGRYTVTFTHPRATLFGLADSPDERDVNLRAGAVARVDLALPSPRTIVSRLCPESAEVGAGLLVGRVRDAERDTVVAGARVRVVWLEEDARGATARWREVVTDSLGIYRACVPRSAPLSVEVTADSLPLTAVPTMFGESTLHVLDVELREAQKPLGQRASAKMTKEHHMDLLKRVASECGVGEAEAERALGTLFMAIRWLITADEYGRVKQAVPEVVGWLSKGTVGSGRTGELSIIVAPDAVERNLRSAGFSDDGIRSLAAVVGGELRVSVPDIAEKVAGKLPLLKG